MNPKSLSAMALATAAIAAAILAPTDSRGQAAPADDPALAAIVTELTTQQETLADQQKKIDAKIEVISENIRQARIFAGRAG